MSRLPPEAVKFAKSMGVDIKGFEAEAETLWQKLESLADKPDEYEAFLRDQAEEMKVSGFGDIKSSSPSTGENCNDAAGDVTYFRPVAMFSIKTITTGGDGIKIRDTNTCSRGSGKDLFINFCSFKGLEQAKDDQGRPTTQFHLPGLEIPLVVGPLRNISKTALATDVVFHPSIMDYCCNNEGSTFRREIVNLALDSVESERGVSFTRTWQPNDKKYGGGLGADSLTPVLFPIEKNEKSSRSDNSAQSNLSNPGTLLSQILKERSASENEVLCDGIATLTTSKSKSKASASTRAKRGFLNDPQNAGTLYPHVSDEDVMGDKGGTLARVMDKCKVVNLTSSGTIEPSPQQKLTSKSDFQAEIPALLTSSPGVHHVPSSAETRRMEQLACELDEDWNVQKSAPAIDDDDFLSTNLMKLSKSCPTLIPPPGVPMDLTLSNSFQLHKNVECGFPDISIISNVSDDSMRISLQEEVYQGCIVIAVRISGLRETDSLDNIHINVTPEEIVVNFVGDERKFCARSSKQKISHERTQASFSRKKRCVKIICFFDK